MTTEKMFQEKLSECKRKIKAEGIYLVGEKKLPYGIQLMVESEQYETLKINLYLSKRGMTHVLSDENTSISTKINEILTETIGQIPKIDECYMGTDESGKGDYFGPLVVAGFISDGDLDRELIQHGVQDCKKMSDKRVRECANYLLSKYTKNCIILSISPEEYNEFHGKLMLEGKKLNDFLAFAHSRVIMAAREKNPEIKMMVTDQFADKKLLMEQIKKSGGVTGKRKAVIQVLPKAENYVAVAAASVLARAAYLKWIEDTSDELGMILPKGCGEDVKFMASALIDKVGKQHLKKYAKVHFKTTDTIMKGHSNYEECLYL